MGELLPVIREDGAPGYIEKQTDFARMLMSAKNSSSL